MQLRRGRELGKLAAALVEHFQHYAVGELALVRRAAFDLVQGPAARAVGDAHGAVGDAPERVEVLVLYLELERRIPVAVRRLHYAVASLAVPIERAGKLDETRALARHGARIERGFDATGVVAGHERQQVE